MGGRVQCSFHKPYSEQQILTISAQLDKSFKAKCLSSKAKKNCFEKTSFELTVTEIITIKSPALDCYDHFYPTR